MAETFHCHPTRIHSLSASLELGGLGKKGSGGGRSAGEEDGSVHMEPNREGVRTVSALGGPLYPEALVGEMSVDGDREPV